MITQFEKILQSLLQEEYKRAEIFVANQINNLKIAGEQLVATDPATSRGDDEIASQL